MNTRNRAFTLSQKGEISEQSSPGRNSNRNKMAGECSTSMDEFTSNEFDLFGKWPIQASQRIQDAYRQYVASSKYKPPWIRGVKSVGVRPRTASKEKNGNSDIDFRSSSSPSFKDLRSTSCSEIFESYDNTGTDYGKDNNNSTEFSSSCYEQIESSSDEPQSRNDFNYLASSVDQFETEDEKESVSQSETHRKKLRNGPIDITCGMVYVCRDKKNEIDSQDTDEESMGVSELIDSEEVAELISSSEGEGESDKESEKCAHKDEKSDEEEEESINDIPQILVSPTTTQRECMKFKQSPICDNPCFHGHRSPDISALTNSGRQRAKIYSLLEGYHLDNCHCKKEDPTEPDPLVALLLDKRGKPQKSVVRLKDYDVLMTRVFKFIYPSAYTSSNFTFTLKPSVVKHVSDLNRFERELTGKSEGTGLADSSDEEGEGGVDRDIIKNLKISEQTRFLAAYNAAEIAARASGCNADEVEKIALSANKDFDVNLTNIRGFPSVYMQQEQLVTVIGYVGLTRPHRGCLWKQQTGCLSCRKNRHRKSPHGSTAHDDSSPTRKSATCKYGSCDELRFSEAD